jgi:SAM-dependent methyltransferase
MFSAGAAYERFMGRWSGHLAPLFVQFAGVRDGDHLLDVGSGTGALTGALAAAAPSSQIVGIDPASPFVDFAQQTRGSHRVHFEVGDAQRLRFDGATFDCTLSLLILNFVPDRAAAVREMLRVTKPGGVVAAAVWDYGEGMEMLRLFWDETVALRPDLDVRDERYMPLCRQGELAALWREHDLRDIADAPLTIETRFEGFDDYWSPFLDQQGPAGACAAALSPVERDALASRLRHRLLGARGDHPVHLRARAWAVRGVVPSPHAAG